MASYPTPRLSAALRQCLATWTIGFALAAFGAAGVAPAVMAQNPASAAALERRVKAAFIYKFLGYTEFPENAFADPTSPILIGVVASDEMADELTRIVAARTIGNRPIVVRRFREHETPGSVHLLFVAGSDAGFVARVMKAAPEGMLLVSECDRGLQQGSVINFTIVDERVRFDVSLEAAEKNNVKLSSRLLTVANRVHKGAP